MKKILVVLAVGAAAVAGSAHGETVAFVRAPLAVPSAEAPNAPGSIVLPSPLTTPPAVPQQRSYGELQRLWQRAGAAYGIPWSVLAAINKVESNFGRNMGPSSAGAIGWMQFLPSTWLRWGLDASGDGVSDPWNPEDAVFAAARYLAAAGGRADLARAVFAYNHAQWYVDEILGLAGQLGRLGTGGAFALDRLAVGVDEAATHVADSERALEAVRRRDGGLARVQASFLRRSRTAALLSERLAARKRAVQIGARRDALAAQARRIEGELAGAQAQLHAARQQAQAAAFAPTGDALLAAPWSGVGDYVFPVGGGAAVVSAGHTHHDYPAVDIAAPAGSPVYALAAAVVEDAWHSEKGRCGIGLTMRTEDGLAWAYCHLSYLASSIGSGSFLPAGTPIGLVGSTGHATGPHLHLQLTPATAYPQELPWFRAFAGSAFSWQDTSGGQTPGRVRTSPVFAVVPGGGGVVAFTR